MSSFATSLQKSSTSIADAPTGMFQPRPFAAPPEQETTEQDNPEEAQDVATAGELYDIPLFPPTPPADNANGSELPVQAKLTIGQPGDKYEQEADRTAAQVMAMPDAAVQRSTQDVTEDDEGAMPAIQRQGLEEDSEEDTTVAQVQPAVQRETLIDDSEEETEKPLRPKSFLQAKGENAQAPQGFETKLAQHKGKGKPLSQEARSFMEPRFGADFSGVRVHEAPQEAGAIKAQAFTHGQDINFISGKYNPGSSSGKELLAHELTHTIQQTGGQVQARKIFHSKAPQNKLQRLQTKFANKQKLQPKLIDGEQPYLNKETDGTIQTPESKQISNRPQDIDGLRKDEATSVTSHSPKAGVSQKDQPETMNTSEATPQNKKVQSETQVKDRPDDKDAILDVLETASAESENLNVAFENSVDISASDTKAQTSIVEKVQKTEGATKSTRKSADGQTPEMPSVSGNSNQVSNKSQNITPSVTAISLPELAKDDSTQATGINNLFPILDEVFNLFISSSDREQGYFILKEGCRC